MPSKEKDRIDIPQKIEGCTFPIRRFQVRRIIVSVLNKVSSVLLPYYGSKLPVVVVNEYPKCGGTWAAKMLASTIDFPFVDGGYFFPFIPCVMRTHWHPRRINAPAVFVVRDGRDVMVSLFHHRCKNIKNVPHLESQYQQRFGETISPEKIKEQLFGFMEIEYSTKRYGSALTWAEHTRLSVKHASEKQRVTLVKFEDMLSDPKAVLSTIVKDCFGTEVGDDRLEMVANLYNKRVSPAPSTIENKFKTTFIRKGTSGGWKEAFTAESAKLFHDQGGTELLELGYESDEDWWKKFDAAS